MKKSPACLRLTESQMCKKHTYYGLIVNTDPHNKPGSHWVAIYGDGDGHTEFFDSYGKPPPENSTVD
jgi:hypothetical protein